MRSQILRLLDAIKDLDEPIKIKMLETCYMTEGDFDTLCTEFYENDETINYEKVKEYVESPEWLEYSLQDRIEMIQALLQVERDIA